jgi:hypothetical protein
MPYVIVDTNALMRDYLLIEANMQTFLQGCQRCHIAVCVPQIVVDELCANFEKEINRQKSTLHTAARKLLAMGVKVEATDFDVKEDAKSYRRHVHQMFEYYDAKVVPYPDISPKSLVAASYSGKKPFKESGEGFKDFIIFETIRAIAAQQDDDGAFVTANKKDFCGSDGKLHPDLQSTLQQQLTVYDNIHDFNLAILTPQLEVLDDIVERIRKGEFDGFDLNETLTACFITELCDKYRQVEAPNSLVEDTTVASVYTPATQDLTVNRLGENELLMGLTGTVELELSGFVPKVELYGMSDEGMENENISIDDFDWNDYVASASTTVEFDFSMTVIFDESKKQIKSVSIDLEPADQS